MSTSDTAAAGDGTGTFKSDEIADLLGRLLEDPTFCPDEGVKMRFDPVDGSGRDS